MILSASTVHHQSNPLVQAGTICTSLRRKRRRACHGSRCLQISMGYVKYVDKLCWHYEQVATLSNRTWLGGLWRWGKGMVKPMVRLLVWTSLDTYGPNRSTRGWQNWSKNIITRSLMVLPFSNETFGSKMIKMEVGQRPRYNRGWYAILRNACCCKMFQICTVNKMFRCSETILF